VWTWRYCNSGWHVLNGKFITSTLLSQRSLLFVGLCCISFVPLQSSVFFIHCAFQSPLNRLRTLHGLTLLSIVCTYVMCCAGEVHWVPRHHSRPAGGHLHRGIRHREAEAGVRRAGGRQGLHRHGTYHLDTVRPTRPPTCDTLLFVVFYLFCFVLFCFVLFCFVLFCFILFCFVLFCFVLFCFVLFCFCFSSY
jgi:hypothetical protein